MRTTTKLILTLGATFLSVNVSYAAPSITANTPTIIALDGYSPKGEEFKTLCKVATEEIQRWSYGTQSNTECLDSNKDAKIISDFEQQKKYGTKVQVVKDSVNNKNKLVIQNLKPVDSLDPIYTRWEAVNSVEGTISLRKLVASYHTFESSTLALKKELVSVALNQNVDGMDFNRKYSEFVHANPENKRFIAAGLELASSLGLSTLGYYSSSGTNNPNNKDWDFNAKQSFEGRIVTQEAVRFDDNHFDTNAGHYLAGVFYYEAARTSGLGRLESLLFTFAGSSTWEYLAEYRETVSINDQINTTFGGFILGEALFQTRRIFQKKPNKGVNKVIRTILGAPDHASGWIQNKATGENKKFQFDLTDEQLDFWSKLDLYAQVEKSKGKEDVKSLGMDAEVINIPMFEEAGQVKTFLTDTVLSNLLIEKGSDGESVDTLKVFAKTTLAAFYAKKLKVDKNEQLEGYQLIVGPTVAFEVNQHYIGETPRANNGQDFRGIVHVLGNTLDMAIYSHGFKIRAILDVYGDFAMIRSWGFDAATNDKYVTQARSNVDTNFPVQSILRNQGYYYGVGVTGVAKVTIEKGRFEAGASYQKSHEAMINGRSRFYESATLDPKASDNVEEFKGWVAYSLTNKLKVEVGVEKIKRSGTALDTTISSSDVVKYGRLVYKY